MPDIPNYMVLAILLTIFGCVLTGIVAIVAAARVNSRLEIRDVLGAREASETAKIWCWITFGVGVAFWTIFLLIGL